VLVTRAREQASALSERLRSAGANAVEFPTIQIVPPQDWGELDAAIQRLYAPREESYDWLILTSANGVSLFFQRLEQLGYRSEDLQAKQHVRIATVGPATTTALGHYHVQADLVPEKYVGEGVVAALLKDAEQRGTSLIGQRFLLARVAEARKALVTDLQKAGALVDDVATYYTFLVASNDIRGQKVLQLLRNHQLDIVTFTSSSTVRNFVAWLSREGVVPLPEIGTDDTGVALSREGAGPLPTDSPLSLLRETWIASIGPITSQTARQLGLHVDIEAKEFTINGLVDAIIKHKELSC
jgi:uroporphyrinogen III methyltransferase/synthase